MNIFANWIILAFGQGTQKQVFWPYLWNYGEAQILFLEGVREEDREIVLLFFFSSLFCMYWYVLHVFSQIFNAVIELNLEPIFFMYISEIALSWQNSDIIHFHK